jgi:cation diffusion facilitator family transporter
MLLAGVGAGIVYHSIVTLPEAHGQPEWVAFWAAVISMAGKEGLYQWTAAVGRRIRSPAVVANAWHHRSDGLSSVPAALAVLAARLLGPDWAFIDHVGAVVVSFFIFRAAWQIVKPALGELTDAGAGEEVRADLERIALETEGVRGIHGLRTRYLGSALQVDLHVSVAPDLSVREGHEISESVKSRLIAEGPDVVDVVTHLEPEERGEPQGPRPS